MIAYKFLDAERTGPFTGFRWPVGAWVEAARVEPCRGGVHACRVQDLPYWLGRELWEIELEGEIVEQERKLVASRGRLVRRRFEWTEVLLAHFVADLLRRTLLRFGSVPLLSGYVADIERFEAQGRTGLAALAAARAAELSRGPHGYERERLRQADWLADRVGLSS